MIRTTPAPVVSPVLSPDRRAAIIQALADWLVAAYRATTAPDASTPLRGGKTS